jgi:alginate O-acetyltransferase complex protein AlgI
MLFNSLTFILFFLGVFSVYWILGKRKPQNVLLLIASYVFYGAWSWKFLILLMASTAVDFTCGILIENARTQRVKRAIMLTSVALSLGFLATFKYLGFFVEEGAALLAALGLQVSRPTLDIVLPIGISFYTFQTIGYVVDVYRRKVPASRNLLEYGLYVAFFPQLVAGPIERAVHLIPQFQRERVWDTRGFESGLQLMVWGLFKKIVIADNLGPYVQAVYAEPGAYSGPALATATVFFAFQIYCDFSGYSDMARGTARLLGFDLMKNFDYPYFSRSPVEFWRRWHISLSQWFQDYLYFPLAMHYVRKGGWASRYKPHIISMGLIGFWHGASWTFVVFGLYWGLVIAAYVYAIEHVRFGRVSNTATAALSVAAMFVVACVGWVFFRAESLTSALYILGHLFSWQGDPTVRHPEVLPAAVLWILVGGLWIGEWMYRHWTGLAEVLERGGLPSIAGRYALVAATLFSYLIAQEGRSHPFIYFQF